MQITAGPIWSYIRNLLPEVNFKLDEALAFKNKAIWFNPKLRRLVAQGLWDGKTRLYDRKTGKFPTGLLDKVKDITGFDSTDRLIDNRFPSDFSWADAIDRAKTLELNGISLAGFQREAIVNNVTQGRGLDLLSVNSGKTEVGIATALAINRKTLWLVNTKELLYQCAKRFELRTGMKAGMVGDGKFEIGDLVTISMVQSINAKENRWKEFLKQFEILIIDECQHAAAPKTWYNLAINCPAPFRFGLSGSLPKEDEIQHKIMGVTDSKVIARITNEQLISTGWSAKPTVFIRPVRYPNNKLDYFEAFDTMIRRNEGYLSIVVKDIVEQHNKGNSVLVLVDRIYQGSRLSQELGGLDIKTVFLSGKDKSSYRNKVVEKFKSGRLPVLIGGRNFNEGIDIKIIQCLILASGGKSPVRQLQRVGRALRKKPDDINEVSIIDYYHLGNDYLDEHSKERAELYESENFDIKWLPEIKLLK